MLLVINMCDACTIQRETGRDSCQSCLINDNNHFRLNRANRLRCHSIASKSTGSDHSLFFTFVVYHYSLFLPKTGLRRFA